MSPVRSVTYVSGRSQQLQGFRLNSNTQRRLHIAIRIMTVIVVVSTVECAIAVWMSGFNYGTISLLVGTAMCMGSIFVGIFALGRVERRDAQKFDFYLVALAG